MRLTAMAIRLMVFVTTSAVLATHGQAATAGGMHVRVTVGSACVAGRGASDARIEVTLRAPDGRMRSRVVERSDGDGRWDACFGSALAIDVNPGDRITVAAAGGSTVARVPDLRPRIDRDTDTIRGRGRAGRTVRIEVGANPHLSRTWTRIVGERGRWRVDTSTVVDLVGGIPVVVVQRHAGFRFRASGFGPLLSVSPHTNVVRGASRPGRSVSVSLWRAGELRATASGLGTGTDLMVMLEDPRGRAVYPRAGDILTSDVVDGVQLPVPRWAIRGSSTTGTVRGRCMPRAEFQLVVGYPDGTSVTELAGRTDDQGRFDRGVDQLRRGQILHLQCRYVGGDAFTVQTMVE